MNTENLTLTWLPEHKLEELFDDELDDIHGYVWILDFKYRLSKALKSVDPVVYRQEYLNWLDRCVECETIILKNDEYFIGE